VSELFLWGLVVVNVLWLLINVLHTQANRRRADEITQRSWEDLMQAEEAGALLRRRRHSVRALGDAERLDWLEQQRAEARKRGFQWNTWAYDALQSELTIREQIDKARGDSGAQEVGRG
jgi:hypothetical protein